MKTVKWTLCLTMICAATFAYQISAIAANTDAMVVDEAGNVGIGTTTPGAKLHLQFPNEGSVAHPDGIVIDYPDGYPNSPSGAAIRVNLQKYSAPHRDLIHLTSEGLSKFCVQADGSVGIGTDTPEATLDVKGNTLLNRLEIKSGGDADIRVTNANDGNYWELNTRNSGRFDIVREGLGNVVSLNKSGMVGIGTTSPGAKLHINGSVRGHQNGALRIDTGNGYVSIGPRNANWTHFYTDRAKYYFDKEIRVNSGNIGSYNGNLNLRTLGTNRITVLSSSGNVGIGTESPSQKLHVEGGVWVKDTISCYNIRTRLPDIDADFVFEEDYDLRDLSEVKAFIQKNKHLPEIPSAAEMLANGISVPEMLKKHLQKIEELTLYMIDLKSDNAKLQSENGDLRAVVHRLEERLSKLETQTLDIDEINN